MTVAESNGAGGQFIHPTSEGMGTVSSLSSSPITVSTRTGEADCVSVPIPNSNGETRIPVTLGMFVTDCPHIKAPASDDVLPKAATGLMRELIATGTAECMHAGRKRAGLEYDIVSDVILIALKFV